LNQITLPRTIAPGVTFTLTSDWANENTAPTYLPWQVDIQLRRGSRTAWDAVSSADLRGLIARRPGQAGHMRHADTLSPPNNLPAGSYQVCIRIVDASGSYARPLALAIEGRRHDGSYCVAHVRVS
jgi:hypothetical protein